MAVTRGRREEDALAGRLRALGAEVLEIPAVATVAPESLAELDAALAAASSFDWIAFASATAVDAVAGRLRDLGLGPLPAAIRLAAVGRATAERLGAALRPPDLVPSEARGEALAAALGPLARGRRVLVPRAAEGRPELVDRLRAAGAEVVVVTAYRTVPAPPATLAPLGDALQRGELHAVAFASPSAVRSVVSALGARAGLLGRTLVAVIGPTTAEAARRAGLRVDVEAAEPAAAALADAIAARLGSG